MRIAGLATRALGDGTVRQRPRGAIGVAYAIFVAGLALSASSCISPATEVIVIVGTDIPPGDLLTVRGFVRVGGVVLRSDAAVGAEAAPASIEWQRDRVDASADGSVSFAIVPAPGGPRDGAVTFVLEGITASNVVRRTIQFQFVRGLRTYLRVYLSARCLQTDARCASSAPCTVQAFCESQGLTCGDQGDCIPPEQVPSTDAGSPFPISQPGMDSGFDTQPADVAVDARADVAMDVDSGPCASGLALCLGTCVDLSTNATNCGACGNACARTFSCGGGTCFCGLDAVCGATCVSLTSNRNHCGSCSNQCAAGLNCHGGTCQ